MIPDELGSALCAAPARHGFCEPGGFIPRGEKRERARISLRELHAPRRAGTDWCRSPPARRSADST